MLFASRGSDNDADEESSLRITERFKLVLFLSHFLT